LNRPKVRCDRCHGSFNDGVAYHRAVRKRTTLSGDLAGLLHRVAFENEQFDVPSLPPVVGGRWGDVPLAGLWGPLRTEGPTLVWQPSVRHGASAEAATALGRLHDLRNAPAVLELADGRRVEAEYGHTPSYGSRDGMEPGLTCEFNVWRTTGGRVPVRWVGRLKGGGFSNGNLVLIRESRSTAMNMRLQGNCTWYLLDTDRTADIAVVVEDGPHVVDRHTLGIDFNALQVALGAPLQLDVLVGLDSPGNVVAVAGTHLGGNRPTKRRRGIDGPVPDGMSQECWVPLFFRRLATAVRDVPDLPWGMACNSYLDSLSDATIDSRYLKAHVALESFAKALLKQSEKGKRKPRSLVTDADAWVRWVNNRISELRPMLAVADDEKVFINKIISAMNPPSSSVVADALLRLDPPLAVDDQVLEEIDQRNIPVHHGAMNKPGVDYEVDRDVERIDVLKALFVALLARACKYDGPITGWVRDEAGPVWKPQPVWWPAPSPETLAEASMMFAAGERTLPRRVAPQRFHSKLLRKSSGSRLWRPARG
jgi:hypothetical protein